MDTLAQKVERKMWPKTVLYACMASVVLGTCLAWPWAFILPIFVWNGKAMTEVEVVYHSGVVYLACQIISGISLFFMTRKVRKEIFSDG